jgi:hypothetical protein
MSLTGNEKIIESRLNKVNEKIAEAKCLFPIISGEDDFDFFRKYVNVAKIIHFNHKNGGSFVLEELSDILSDIQGLYINDNYSIKSIPKKKALDIENLCEAFVFTINEVKKLNNNYYYLFKELNEKWTRLIQEDDKKIFGKISSSIRNQFKSFNIDGGSNWNLINLYSVTWLSKAKEIINQVDEIQRNTEREENLSLEDEKNKKMLSLYKAQMDMLIQYKKEGLAIESEIFSMREKLLNLEKQENSAMLQELMQTLDSI